MGYANATGPSVRHTITTSPALAERMAADCATEGITASELVRRWAAAYYGDPAVAAMRSRGQPRKDSEPQEPGKTKAKRELSKINKISHKKT